MFFYIIHHFFFVFIYLLLMLLIDYIILVRKFNLSYDINIYGNFFFTDLVCFCEIYILPEHNGPFIIFIHGLRNLVDGHAFMFVVNIRVLLVMSFYIRESGLVSPFSI